MMRQVIAGSLLVMVAVSIFGCSTVRQGTVTVRSKSILVTYAWMEDRPKIANGTTVDEASKALGGPPASTNFDKNGDGPAWWRFHYHDSLGSLLHMDYQGDFVHGKLVGYGWSSQPHYTKSAKYRKAIRTTREQLYGRVDKVQEQDTLRKVNSVLGGAPYTGSFDEHGSGQAFWRFMITDSKERQAQYEIFQGVFKGGKLKEGSFLPH